jgi:hypothetical protein
MTVNAIALAKRQFPRLCPDGLYPFPGTASRAIDPKQVEVAIEFLSMLTPTKTVRISSGTLKHFAETWAKRHGLCSYISRGALTAAAVTVGLVVKSYGPLFAFNPAVGIGVSMKDLKRLFAEPTNKRDGR